MWVIGAGSVAERVRVLDGLVDLGMHSKDQPSIGLKLLIRLKLRQKGI